jgi:hypothetical protein
MRERSLLIVYVYDAIADQSIPAEVTFNQIDDMGFVMALFKFIKWFQLFWHFKENIYSIHPSHDEAENVALNIVVTFLGNNRMERLATVLKPNHCLNSTF